MSQRTKVTPSSGPATTYGYDQAGDLTSVTRPKEGEAPAIEDSYAYNGDGLRVSRTSASTTSYLTWSADEKLPLLLAEGETSIVYGANNLPVEQITGEASRTYIHHDAQGSTRVLTNGTGEVVATRTYDGYGNVTGHTGTTSSLLGYAGQYTDSDTGLMYLRARVYDPATAQFLSPDPATELTHAPFTYATDDPVNRSDENGLGYEPDAAEKDFLHAFAREEKRAYAHVAYESNTQAKHTFDDYIMYLGLYNAAEDPSLKARWEETYERAKAKLYAYVFSEYAPLEELQWATSAKQVAKIVAKVFAKVFG
jgi:RHS repeat-associated protein